MKAVLTDLITGRPRFNVPRVCVGRFINENFNTMTKEKLTQLLKIAYRWGRDNGEGRSEKNFNDLLDTKAVNEALRIHDVVGQSKQLCPHKSLQSAMCEVDYCPDCNTYIPS